MRTTNFFSKTLALSATLFLSSVSFAKDSQAPILGTGVVYTAPNQALFINPANLSDGMNTSLEAIWAFSGSQLHASVVGGVSSVGLGAGYRNGGGNSAVGSSNGGNIFEAGLAVNLGAPRFGLTLRSYNGSGFDADLGFAFDLSKVRLGVVAEGVSGGLDRLSTGVGVMAGPARFEFDVRKPFPLNSNVFLFDFALAVDADPIAVQVGYEFSHSDKFNNGGIHAGLAYMVTKNFLVQGYYDPFPQEALGGQWALGARYQF